MGLVFKGNKNALTNRRTTTRKLHVSMRNLLCTSLNKAVLQHRRETALRSPEKWRLRGRVFHASGSSRRPATQPGGQDKASTAPNFLSEFLQHSSQSEEQSHNLLVCIPGSGRSPGEGNGYPLQYSCLGNPADRGAWWATSMGHTESGTTDHTGTHRNRLSSESLYS